MISGQPAQMAGMPHAALYSARGQATPEQQNVISPYEHRAFAREAVAENPMMALPIAAAIPAYQLYKSIFGARSSPSLAQVGQGYLGIGEGLYQGLMPK